MAVKFQGGRAVPMSGADKGQEFYKSVYSAWTRGDYTRVKELASTDPKLRHIALLASDIVALQLKMRDAMKMVMYGAKTPD